MIKDIEFRNPSPCSSGCFIKRLFALSRKPFSKLHSFQQDRISPWKEGVVLVKSGWKILKCTAIPKALFCWVRKVTDKIVFEI